MRSHFGGVNVAWMCVVLTAVAGHVVQCQLQHHQEQSSQHHAHVGSRAGRNTSVTTRYNRTSVPSSGLCDHRDILSRLHDRVGTLVSLDEKQRERLDSMEQKIAQFEERNLARLDSISVQQGDANRRLEAIESLQRGTHHQMQELRGELKLLLQEAHRQVEDEGRRLHDNAVTRSSRQANNTNYGGGEPQPATPDLHLDCSAKLNALSIFLTSTRLSINELHSQLAENITRLMQATGNLQRRFNTFARRQGQGSVQPNLYPVPAVLTSRSAEGVCTYARPDDSLGIQRLQLTSDSAAFFAACDDKIHGGGWTVVQNRYSGEINFQRDWLEYKTGFGNIAGEFFIGLDKLHALTSSTVHELLILMADSENEQRHARYSSFAIGGEKELYALSLLGAYSGNAGDAFSYHAGSKFSTFDNDNDGWLEGNCALAHTGAWWYNACEKCNLNGQYLNGEYDQSQTFQGMYWEDFHGPTYALRSVRMMIRPISGEQEQRR